MSGGISMGTMAMMAATAAGVAAISKKTGMPVSAGPMPPLPPPVQSAVAPDQQATRRNSTSSSGGYGPGAATTMLTGGVDPSEMLLGKNKLLGM